MVPSDHTRLLLPGASTDPTLGHTKGHPRLTGIPVPSGIPVALEGKE